jgi:hypothetical protein
MSKSEMNDTEILEDRVEDLLSMKYQAEKRMKSLKKAKRRMESKSTNVTNTSLKTQDWINLLEKADMNLKQFDEIYKKANEPMKNYTKWNEEAGDVLIRYILCPAPKNMTLMAEFETLSKKAEVYSKICLGIIDEVQPYMDNFAKLSQEALDLRNKNNANLTSTAKS